MQDSYERHDINTSHDASSAAELSAQIFSDPKDFLNTLRSNFQEIAHGHDQISALDLQDSATHGGSAKTRAAAKLALEHVQDFDKIRNQIYGTRGYKDGQFISKEDLDVAIDMNDHNTHAYTKRLVEIEVAALAVTGAAAAGPAVPTYWMAAAMIEAGTLSGVGEVAALGLVTIGTAAAAVYVGYRAVTENSRMHELADRDSAMFNEWLGHPVKH
jgi:hypothetical protein